MTSRKLVLFGGTGFVGAHILRGALQRGWSVVCATRGGLPPPNHPILDAIPRDGAARPLAVDFVAIDATRRAQVRALLSDHSDASAVVSCVGRLTRDHAEARRVCGDANAHIAAALFEETSAARRLVLVSAEPLDASLRVLRHRFLLKGYFQGKRAAERAVLENLGERGVVLRPGFIHGTRYVQMGDGFLPIPLWVVGAPLEAVLQRLGRRGGLFVPPIRVEAVAAAALGALEKGAPSGVFDYVGMHELGALGRAQQMKLTRGEEGEGGERKRDVK